MKRSGFIRNVHKRHKSIPTPGTGRGVHGPSADVPVVVAKEAPVRSEAYRRLVASLPCDRCKVDGRSQAAHGDADKGMGIKSSDLTCYPLCGPAPAAYRGCHDTIGSSGFLTRDERRKYEAEAGARTRLKLIVMAQDDPKVAKVLRDVGLLP